MQDWRDEVKERCRTGGMLKWRDKGKRKEKKKRRY